VTNLLRSGDKINGEVEKLTKELEVLKNHIGQIKIGQTQNITPNSNNNYQSGEQTSYDNGFSFYNRNQHYQPPIFNNPNEYYQNNPRPNFYPNYNYSTNNNQMTITRFPKPNGDFGAEAKILKNVILVNIFLLYITYTFELRIASIYGLIKTINY